MAVGSYNAVGLVHFDEIPGEHRGFAPISELPGAAVASLATVACLGLSALSQITNDWHEVPGRLMEHV